MSFRTRVSLLVLSAGIVLPALAHAETFIFNAVLNTPTSAGAPVGTVTGKAEGFVDFDTTTQKFTGGDFKVTNNGASYNLSYVYYSEQADTVDYGLFLVDDNATGGVALQISVPLGFTGGDACSAADSTHCLQTGNAPHYYNTSLNAINTTSGNLEGTLSIASSATLVPTPEPSSLALLGTGLVGAMGLVRRRFTR